MDTERIAELERKSENPRHRLSPDSNDDPARILNTREKKELLKEIEDHYGMDPELFRENNFIARGDRIHISSKFGFPETSRRLVIEGIGMLFARISATLKLTTNAIQLYGRYAMKNIVELNESERTQYLRGFDIEKKDTGSTGYVVVRCGSDNLGCGLMKDGILQNQIPKQRRIKKL